MALKLDGRYRPSELDRALAGLAAAHKREGMRASLLVAAGGGVVLALSWASFAFFPGEFGIGIVVLVLGIIGLVFFGGALVSAHRRAGHKLRFARGLCEELLDDFHPGRKVRIELDLADYDALGKRYWQGKSIHGNTKYKYADRWLILRLVLADGTRVRLVRKADVKTKKGDIVRHKRQLYAHLDPAPERYGRGPWDVSVLDSIVRTAIDREFHDPPEDMRVRAARRGASIDLKVTQLDAEILPREVTTVLDATLSAVHLHRLDPK